MHVAAAPRVRGIRRTGRRTRRNPPLHLWATVSAITADGVPAYLHVELPWYAAVGRSRRAELAAEIAQRVEEALRHRVSTLDAAELPAVGATTDWTSFEFPEGVTGPGRVLACDLEVTPMLQRMLLGRLAP